MHSTGKLGSSSEPKHYFIGVNESVWQCLKSKKREPTMPIGYMNHFEHYFVCLSCWEPRVSKGPKNGFFFFFINLFIGTDFYLMG